MQKAVIVSGVKDTSPYIQEPEYEHKALYKSRWKRDKKRQDWQGVGKRRKPPVR